MSLDLHGYLWLSNPWVAAFAIVMAVGLLLWCHYTVDADGSGRSVAVPVRAQRTPSTSGRNAASVLGASCRASTKRERRDAIRRRVA